MNNRLACVTWLLFVFAQQPVSALAEENMKFSGRLVGPPACSFNEGTVLEVDFGEMVTSKIDGKNYKKEVDYALTCSNASKVSLRFCCGAAGFEGAIYVGVPDFGLKAYADDKALNIGDSYSFTYPNNPKLSFIPVKKQGATLKGGGFSAGTTLQIAFP
ncbi:type 1 fimbria pilin [Pseudomonas alcaligenes]|nr:type 1 fimbria pilin [Pseudomonas alcaligenes]